MTTTSTRPDLAAIIERKDLPTGRAIRLADSLDHAMTLLEHALTQEVRHVDCLDLLRTLRKAAWRRACP